METNCEWCLDESAEDITENLCRMHLAECEGLSLDGLDRMESEQAAEYREWVGA